MMQTIFRKIGSQKRKLTWLPILITRSFLGFYFLINGFMGIWQSDRHKDILDIMQTLGFQQPDLMAYLFPLLQITCSMLLIIGLLTTLSSLLLFFLSISLMAGEGIASLQSLHGMALIEGFFSLPSLLMSLLLFWLMIAGPEKVSLDHKYGHNESPPPPY
ncbi:MAG: DoxX family membrane protein [Chlamydiota bacterium]|nr:DoxX family membrane protein [Chlamydiota bacterium]